MLFVRKRILNLCFRTNELGVCALLLSGGASFVVYSGIHRLVMNKASVKAALQNQDANHKVTAEIKKLIQTNEAYKDEQSASDLRFVVAHASDQALPLHVAVSATNALNEIKKNESKKSPAEFKEWLRNKAHASRLSSRSYPVDNLRDVLKVVKEIHPGLDVEAALKTILERSDKALMSDASKDRVDRFRMIAYKEKVKISTLEMENYLIENIPPDLISKLKDDKQFNKFIARLPHSSRHWWSATWRWLANLLVTKKANDYTGENLIVAATRPTSILNFVFFGPIAEPLKLSVDHVSSRFMHRMTGKPWRPGALTHLATTYTVGALVWSKSFLFPYILGPLADKQREESFEEAFEEQILGDDPETVAKRKELALRVIYDQRFHRYYIDKDMKGEEKQDLRLKVAPIYLEQLTDFYEKSKADTFKSTEEYLEHPVFYKEKEYAEKGFPLELEETQYLRSMKFNVAGNAYRYKKTPSGDRVKLNSSQLKSIVEIKKEYLLRSEAIFQIKKLKANTGLPWNTAVSKYLETLPIELQENFMKFFAATSASVTGKAVAQVLDMGIENGVRDEAGALVFTMDNNQISMMLQALANAEMEWSLNEVLGRQMNRKRKTVSGTLVYENTGPVVTKEQYIGRMPGDMLFILKSIQESEEQAETYQSIFERMSK